MAGTQLVGPHAVLIEVLGRDVLDEVEVSPVGRERVEDVVPGKPQLPHDSHLLDVDERETAVLPKSRTRSRLAEQKPTTVRHQAVSRTVERNHGYPPRPCERHEPEHATVPATDDLHRRRVARGHGNVTDDAAGEPVPPLLNPRAG